METTANKSHRTPSLCRQWEKNRRNKFNNAISRLGETVKEINKTFDGSCKDDNTQYPKIEIIEKAIVCLRKCSEEKTQMRAEILALQIKIDGYQNTKETKDASTQVLINISREKRNSKYMNILMVKESKRKALKEKPVQTTNVIDKTNCEKSSTKEGSKSTQKLPLILPKITSNDKKGTENTIVVLPAAPYIIPQRPLLLPTMPPTFVIVDPNLQTLNKTFPVTKRTNSDVTKTTMVNILPITAYSRPLSASKSKRGKIKNKIDVPKRSVKKCKQNNTVNKDITPVTSNNGVDVTLSGENDNKTITGIDNTKSSGEKETSSKTCELTKKPEDVSTNHKNTDISKSENIQANQSQKNTKVNENQKEQLKEHDTSKETSKRVSTNTDLIKKTTSFSDPTTVLQSTKVNDETNHLKTETPKQILAQDKDKENKLPVILDTALCENTVDGGNARLELAEEFLAASPTAAFLMSFPLVSGNRADSPAEENTNQIQVKDNNKRSDTVPVPQIIPYLEKHTDLKSKSTVKTNIISSKQTELSKYAVNVDSKSTNSKTSNVPVITSNVSNENPFLNLPMTSLISTSGTLPDGTYLDFDCNLGKPVTTQSATYISSSNLFYKSDPFNTVKSSIYSTSNISSGHEFNSFGLYPCAVEKYTTSKNKTDFLNVEENLMKIGSSRLTYDIDLGWSHKGFDFVGSTSAPTTFSKDNILTTSAASYSSSYNPFNSEFHVPLTSASHKKDNGSTKTISSFADTITSFYSQPANLWSEDVPFYTNTNMSKNSSSKQQNYFPVDHAQPNVKLTNSKQYDTKQLSQAREENLIKSANMLAAHQMPEKYTKKSPSKTHINWMTSEIRPMQTNCNPPNPPHVELKGPSKTVSHYSQIDHIIPKKQENADGNYFPISMNNFQHAAPQDELLTWPSTRQTGTTEISIEPPPINLPTLVGDLALGPHDRKKNADIANRGATQTDIQNCSNFFSVTQLMNRSTDNNITSRYHGLNVETSKSNSTKHNITQAASENIRKPMSRLEQHHPEPCYIYNDPKTANAYENMNNYTQGKTKLSKSDKNSKAQKHSYSAEALIRGGSCTQKLQDNTRFIGASQKYNDYNIPQDNSVAQVSHFPPLLDYSDNNYTGQQYSGTTLYNSTTNTLTNSFYTNFIPSSSNIMSSNYSNGPFSSDFMDYNQTAECSYNHKYEELKIRNNAPTFQQDKVPSNYKSSRRESAAKHKLECSKKESKKYQSKRAKLNADVDEWSDPNMLWQNRAPSKRHSNLVSEDLPFPNYVGNQMVGQYQPELLGGPLAPHAPAPAPGMAAGAGGHSADRSLANFAATSRANFNLSTIFPEITMKVQ